MVGTVQQSAEPVVDTVDETPHLAQETVGTATQPVLETAKETTEAGDPVVQPVADTVEPIVRPVKDTVEPVVEPVVDPVKETIGSVIEPVRETVDPVIDPGEETPEPVIDPVRDPDNPAGAPGAKPAQETIDPLDQRGPGLKPNERPNPGVATTNRPDELPNRGPQPTGATIEAPAGPAWQAAAAVLEEGAVRAGEGISLDASSRSLAGTSVNLQEVRGASTRGVMLSEQAMVVTVATGGEGSLLPSFSLGVSIGEHSSIVDYFTTTAHGARGVLPRPSPFSGATPTGAAGSSSSGLGASSGGLGFGTLVAMLLTLSALRGRLLLFSHVFLRPNSALVLAIERPG